MVDRGTMTSHPSTAAAILGNLEPIIEEDPLAQAKATASYLGEGLQRVAERHPIAAYVTGLGLT